MSSVAEIKQKFASIAQDKGLLAEQVTVEVKTLTAQQAIGRPERDDFPLLKGKERIIEARFKGSSGQAFTDAFREYQGDISSLLRLDLADRFNLSVFIAALNAVMRYLDLVEGTVHCRNEEPTQCAQKLSQFIAGHYPEVKRIALVGLQPAMAAALAQDYELGILDLDPDNIGNQRCGLLVRDGHQDLLELAQGSDLVLATGSTLTNHTLDQVRLAAKGRHLLFFGITISGAARLLGVRRFCPLGH